MNHPVNHPVTAAVSTGPPLLRRLPTPRTEPPYDDEIAVASGHSAAQPGPGRTEVQGTLALAFVLPSGLPAVPAAPRLRLLPGGASPERHDPGPLTAARSDLPDPRAWAARLVQALVEVLAGERPAGQLVRWTEPDVFAELCRRSVAAMRRVAAQHAGEPGVDSPRAAVRSVRVMEPTDGIAEVCALVQRGVRTTAIALRLEGRDGRWRCTALELVGSTGTVGG